MSKPNKVGNPPRWATKFLHWYCKDDLVEEIEGDILEE
jgi:putative ABC transport system permease protein